MSLRARVMSEARIHEILEQLGARDPQDAWAAFLEDHAALIYQVVRHFEPDSDQASDCFQFICERLCENRFRRLRRFKPGGAAKFSTWLRVVARNLCLDWRRKEFGRRRVFRSVARLSELDQEVFRLVFERGATRTETLPDLKRKFPHLTAESVSDAIERINQTLTTNQRWLLRSRAATSARRTIEKSGEIERTEVIDPQANPEELALETERSRLLNRALSRLSVKDRFLVRLRFEEQLTLDQIAKLLDLGNAQRADRQLRQILAALRLELDSHSAPGVRGKTSSSSVKAV